MGWQEERRSSHRDRSPRRDRDRKPQRNRERSPQRDRDPQHDRDRNPQHDRDRSSQRGHVPHERCRRRPDRRHSREPERRCGRSHDRAERRRQSSQARGPERAARGGGDWGANVAGHYDAQAAKGGTVQSRRQSTIFALRSFHNHIKRELLKEYMPSGEPTLLDLGCGKGGDIAKWLDAGARQVFGIDISGASVAEAERRNLSLPSSKLRGRSTNWATFIQFDVAGPDLRNALPKSAPKQFDIVSCQFTLHYMFESRETAMQLLRNAAEALKPGGMFVGTFAAGDRIMQHLTRDPAGARTNHVLKVKAQFDTTVDATHTEFGLKYTFSLQDAIDGCPEYVTWPDTLVDIARENGLKMIQLKPFDEWLTGYRGNNLSEDEKEASFLYSSFVFQKEAEDSETEDVQR